MKLVTFAVDRVAHSLIASFPVFIKYYRQHYFAMYETESVPIPILGKITKANSYSQIRIHKPYAAVGEDYYIQLCMTELTICKSIRYTYYCGELFEVKHKNKHSFANAIFYDLGPKMVTKNYHFDYYFNKIPNVGLPQSATAEHTYAVVPKDFLCDCQLDLEHASVLFQLSSCTHKNKTKHLTMEFVVNMGFISCYTIDILNWLRK